MRSPKDLPLLGGLVCLDFVNSVDWRGREEPVEYLLTYADLVEWSTLAGAITATEANSLRRAVSKPAAAAALGRTIDFRESAYRVLRAALRRESPEAPDVQRVNAVVSQARAHAQLQPSRLGYTWTFSDAKNPDLPLWALAVSVADLLTTDDLRRVRLCGGPECGWLFLDDSKNQRRRWCSMQGCGNRAKARRHYARTAKAFVLALLVPLFAASSGSRAFAAMAQVSVPQIRALSLNPKDKPDAWSAATLVSLPWEVQRQRPMHEPTMARVATDGTFLYVRFDVTQSEPIAATQRTNNLGQGTDDEVWIDLWPTGATGYQYQFFATPNGTHYQTSTENLAYAPQWESYGVATPAGYTVTMKIPLAALRAGSSHTWKAQFARFVRATGEQAVWTYDPAQTNPDDPARAGSLQMPIAEVAKRAQPRISTYALGALAAKSAGGSTSRIGLDLSVPITESTSFFATFHPDFSNVELDQQTISPTVVQRAYAEVRPFFTQGSGNFNNFYCNFCNALTPLYTPAIPTPRSGYAIEGKAGQFSFTSFDAQGVARNDQATGVTFQTPDTRWVGSVDRVTVQMPGFFDVETVAGAFYQDLKHTVLYANYGADAGTDVPRNGNARYYDAGATWSSQTFSIWGGLHRIGRYFNPADGFTLYPDVAGWGLYANKIWTPAPRDLFAAISVGGDVVRNHGEAGGLDQTSNKLDLDLLTRGSIDLNLTSGSSYLRLGNGVLTPISQSGASLTLRSGSQTNNPVSFDAHGPSATPTTLAFNTGRFGNGRLNTWLRQSTLRAGPRGTVSLELDDTDQWADGVRNVQWFERFAYTHQLSAESTLSIGLRRITGRAPVPNGGGNCDDVCSNISVAYYARFRHMEWYLAYGDPNTLTTVPQLLFKAIFYAGAEKGT